MRDEEVARTRGEQLPLAGYAWGDRDGRRGQVQAWLGERGYDLAKQVPPALNILGIMLILVAFGSLSGATFGPVASLLSEMFPPQIRYSSMSIPYHIGTGYFGGFLPLIATATSSRIHVYHSPAKISPVSATIALAISGRNPPK